MAYEFPPDVEKLVRGYMATLGYGSEDEVLRTALHALGQFEHSPQEVADEYRETVAAVREGNSDAQAGRMRPLRDIIDEAGGKPSAEIE